jgi:hypothetical protein
VAKRNKEEKPVEYTRRQLSHAKKQARRQKITLYSGFAVVVAVIALLLVGFLVSEYIPMHKTVLTVGKVKFTMADYIDTMKVIRQNNSTLNTSNVAQQAYQSMMQAEIVKVGAASLNVTVSNDDIKLYLKAANLADNKSSEAYYRAQIALQQLEAGYFGSQVPATADQVHPLMMMLESDQQAAEVRQQLVNGANFTLLAGNLGQDYYSKNMNQGDFGMHIRDVLSDEVSSQIPLDYAFSAPIGSLSQPLTDNATNKQSGYWLIKIAERPSSNNVTVQALFLSDNVTASSVRDQLVNGGSLANLADKYTQYSLSKSTHGNIGVILQSDNASYTQAFNTYLWDSNSPVGAWSQPIHESELWTVGGSWLVKVLDKQTNTTVSDEDRQTIVSKLVNNWYTDLTNQSNLTSNTELLTPQMQQWAMNRLDKEMPLRTTQTS